jgi:amidase
MLAAQYPQITVPLGFLADNTTIVKEGNFTVETPLVYPTQPFGLTFAGTADSEANLLAYAYAFEQGESGVRSLTDFSDFGAATHVRKQRKSYKKATPKTQLKDVLQSSGPKFVMQLQQEGAA